MTLPAAKAAVAGLAEASRRQYDGVESEEMPISILYASITLALVTLFAVTVAGLGLEPHPIDTILRSLLVAVVGSAWIWFASIIIAQATGMTDWTPLSGMALLTVVVLMYLTGGAVVPSIMLGSAVSVACSLSADMMQDLKTGQLVGSRPDRQQIVQLACCGLGPVISLAVVMLIWQTGPDGTNGFGPGTAVAVPQADALRAVIEQVQGETIDWTRYSAGALVGGLLSLSGVPGLGVILGIAMYLGIGIVLPYGFGAIAREVLGRVYGAGWCESVGVPSAVGLIVGDGLSTLFFAVLTVLGVLQ